jgi:hypothetical protein
MLGFSRLISILLFAFSAAFAQGINADEKNLSLVVVVKAASPIERLSKKEVIDIYMGRFQTFPNGTPVAPIDFPAGSDEKKSFYKQLVGKDERKIKAYWSRLLFSGRATPPIQADSKQQVLEGLNDQALAYLPANEVTQEMKIVYQL